MAKSAAAAPEHLVELVPLSKIVESPSNPRKTFTEIEDLAEDIKKRGVLQPVLLRSTGINGLASNMLELVFGARRFRAAKLAGLEAIPAMVRDLSAVEALEIQVVENSARQDVHPMEEAEGFERLRELTPGDQLSVEDIAAKIGKSASYVYGRMRLLNLCAEGRKAFYGGQLTATSALALARVPDQGLQRELVKQFRQWWGDETWSTHQVADNVIRRLLRLASAPFPKDDPELTDAGPCTTCPKRSGAQPALFSDVDKKDDLCTDPACYRAKAEAGWKRQRAAAEAKGLKVLDGKAAEKALTSNEYVRLDHQNYQDPKYRTWKQLIGKVAKDQVVIARGEDDRVYELVPKKATGKLLKEAGHNFKSERSSSPSRARSHPATKEDPAVRAEVERRMRTLILDACRKRGDEPEAWRIAVDWAALADDGGIIPARFPELEQKNYHEREKQMARQLASLDVAELRALALAIAVSTYVLDDFGDRAAAVRKWAGIDEKALTAQVTSELAAKEKGGGLVTTDMAAAAEHLGISTSKKAGKGRKAKGA